MDARTSRTPRAAKVARLNVRATAVQREVIAEAAALEGKTQSAFLLDAAFNAARNVLADRRLFSLDDVQRDEFLAFLDRPPVEKPHLRKLLQSPSTLGA